MKTLIAFGSAVVLLSGTAATAQNIGGTVGAVAEAGLPPVESALPSAPDIAVTHEGSAHADGAGADTHASASFSEAQIDSYVSAAIAVQEMQADSSLDAAAQQARAGSILAEVGLDPSTFNAISDAVKSDPAVAQRVQIALANRRGSPQG